jgi:hypothetical protein
MTMIASAIAWFGARSLLAKLGTYAVIALVAWGGFELYKKSLRNEGYRRAIEDVKSANKEMSDAARKAIDRVRACRDAGGVWQQHLGQCDGGL